MNRGVIFIFLILFFISLISADLISINAGGTAEVAVDSGANIEGFFFGSFCGDGVCNVGETCSSCPSDCGVCSGGGAGGGGGGGGPSCYYDWVCTNWSPYECPASGIQERICMNKGTCTGIIGLPVQIQNCTYEHKEPLFDIFLTISESYKEICSGEQIKANIVLENYGKIELLDAFMTYWIVDNNNSLISEIKDTRNVADKLNFDISMSMPESTPSGTYRLYADITYSGNKTAIAGDSFEVVEGDYCNLVFNLMTYLPVIIIGAGFLIVILIVLILIIALIRKICKLVKRKKSKKHKRKK